MKNRLKISIIGTFFFCFSAFSPLSAQNSGNGEHYYSNSRLGIKPAKVTPYIDSNIVSKSENLTIEIEGEVGDTVVPADSIKGQFDKEGYYDYQYAARINRFHRNMGWDYYDDFYTNSYWYCHDPFLWGSSIYWTPGWSFGMGWSSWWGPYWGVNYGWYLGNGWYASVGWNWGYGWYDPFFDPYWGYGYPGYYGYGYYGYGYGYGSGYGRGFASNGWGHQYLGSGRNSGRPMESYRPSRPAAGSPTPVRRGGVDINPNGRPSNSRGTQVTGGRDAVSGTTYSKPERISNSRTAMASGRTTSDRSNYATGTTTSRTAPSAYRTGNTSSLRTGSTASYREGSSSVRNGSSSVRSSSSSSTYRSSSSSYSPSRSSSSFGGSSHSSFGSSSSSRSSSSSSSSRR